MIGPNLAGVNRVLSRIEEIVQRSMPDVPTQGNARDRFIDVLDEVSQSPRPRASGRTSYEELQPVIDRCAADYNVDSEMIRAMIEVESGWNADAVSGKGAQGLMQLMPGTARRFSVSSPYDIEQNVRGGSTYLKILLGEFGTHRLAAAGYNAGEGNVRKYGRNVPPFEETKAYVPIVLKNFNTYKQNPHLIGLGDSESPTAGSGCDARELC